MDAELRVRVDVWGHGMGRSGLSGAPCSSRFPPCVHVHTQKTPNQIDSTGRHMLELALRELVCALSNTLTDLSIRTAPERRDLRKRVCVCACARARVCVLEERLSISSGWVRSCWCTTYPRYQHVEYDTHGPHVAFVVILAV